MVFRMRLFPRVITFLAFVAGSYTFSAFALPRAILLELTPCGARVGTTLDVTVRGSDLDETTSLVFSDPRIRGEALRGDKGPFDRPGDLVPNKFRVTISDSVEPGVYDVRARGLFGMSNPRAFVVSRVPLVLEAEGNSATHDSAQKVELDTTIHGKIGGATDIDFYRFSARAGSRVLVDCRARRIDSDLEAVLVLLNGQGAEIQRSRHDRTRDPMIDFAVPADGEYIVKLTDGTFAGGPAFFYHLSIGTSPHVDFVFPPAGMPGSRGKYTLYGRNLPGGTSVPDATVEGRPLESLQVDIQLPWQGNLQALPYRLFLPSTAAFVDATAYRFRTAVETANPVILSLASAPVVAESSNNDEPSKSLVVPLPCEFVGQFYPAADQDWVLFEAHAGEVYWLEVFSHRLGQPTDPQIVVRKFDWNDKGEISSKHIASHDDLGGTDVGHRHFNVGTDDPALRFAAPETGIYGAVVRDLSSSVTADPRNVYRLSIRHESPDFRLVAVPRRIAKDPNPALPPPLTSVFLRAGGTAVVEVLAERQHGLGQEIEVFARDLPPGVRAEPVSITPGRRNVSLILEAATDAPDWQGHLRVFGRARFGDMTIEREARSGAVAASSNVNYRSRLTQAVELTVAGRDKFPYTISVKGGNKVFRVARAGKVTIPIAVERREGHEGPVILTPFRVPAHVAAKPVTLAPDKLEGELVLQSKKETPIGVTSIFVRCQSKIKHARNPGAVERAVAWKEKMESLVKDLEAQTAAAAADADKAALDKRLKEAVAERDRAAKQAQDLGNANAPKPHDVYFAALPLKVQVVQTPFDMALSFREKRLQRGAKAELTVAVPRHPGFEGEIDVRLVLPESLKGVQATPVKLPKEQSEAKFVLELAEGATPGRHAVTFKGITTFANENREMTTAPVVLEIR